MLDWPEANHTSPTRMSSRTILLVPVTVSWYGPPADSGGRNALQLPRLSLIASRLTPCNSTETFSSGFDQPQM